MNEHNTATPLWHVNRGGQSLGPYRWEELQAYIQEGRLGGEDYVWHEGMPAWASITEVMVGQGESSPEATAAVPAGAGGSGTGSAFAPAAGGQMILQAIPAVSAISPVNLSPLQFLLGGGRGLLQGFTAVFKDKKRLIPVLLLAAVWVLLLILGARGADSSGLSFFNFLTFARGGLSGGVMGFLGGIMGKGLLAYGFTLLVMPLLYKRNPLTGLGSRLGGLHRFFAVRDLNTLFMMLLGAGVALIGYNFLTGDASPQNSMAGIAALLLTLRAMTRRAGFLQTFIRSLLYRFSSRKKVNTGAATPIMAGMASGFALSMPLTLIPIDTIAYLAGAGLLLIALVIWLISSRQKQVTA